MPGVPFSKACSNCRARKTKCDETEPACKKCTSKGLKCDGFRIRYKFMNYASQKSEPNKQRRNSDESSTSTTSDPTTGSDTSISSDASATVKDLIFTPPPSVQIISMLPEGLRGRQRQGFDLLVRSPLACTYIARPEAALFWQVDQASVSRSWSELMDIDDPLPTYVQLLPRFWGRNSALDAAATCLFRAAAGVTNTADSEVLVQCRTLYGHALKSMQAVLSNERKFKSAETLAAIMILSAFEALTGTTPDSWLRHMSGLGNLFEARGPDVPFNELDYSILDGAMGGIYADALLNNKPCFLNKPEWQKILHDPKFGERLDNITPHACQLPELMMECREIVHHKESRTPEKIKTLLNKALAMRAQFLEIRLKRNWHITSMPEILAPDSRQKNSRFLLRRSDLNTGAFCNHCAGTILINRVIYAMSPAYRVTELDTIELCDMIQGLHAPVLAQTGLKSFYRFLSLRVAHAATTSAELWSHRPVEFPDGEKEASSALGTSVIDSEAFDAFDDIVCGRRAPNG